VNGYLMDTNHVAGWEADHQSILAKINSLPKDTLIFASAITLGEMAAGHEMTQGDPRRRQLVRNFLNIYVVPSALSITHSTAQTYGKIIGRIWKKRPPSSPNTKTEAHLVSLGVDINDVWIVACAWEHGLTLLTRDAMTCIKEAISPDVEWDSWL
jgi:predicted nucleic acid-binding protein